MFTTFPISSPPALRPHTASPFGDVTPSDTRCSAQSTKSAGMDGRIDGILVIRFDPRQRQKKSAGGGMIDGHYFMATSSRRQAQGGNDGWSPVLRWAAHLGREWHRRRGRSRREVHFGLEGGTTRCQVNVVLLLLAVKSSGASGLLGNYNCPVANIFRRQHFVMFYERRRTDNTSC